MRWFKDENGYVGLTADDGEVRFVYFSALDAEGYRTLEPGQRVTFVRNDGIHDHGRHADVSVRPEPS